MTTKKLASAKPLPRTPYEIFRQALFEESPRAAYWLESMVFGMMAQVDDMTEDTALELACKIVLQDRATPGNPRTNVRHKIVENDSKRKADDCRALFI